MDKRFVIKEFYDQELMALHNIDFNYAMRNPHFHDGYEINLAVTGGVRFYIEDKEYHLESGTVTLINNNEIHYNVAPPNQKYERYIISFLPEFLTDFNSGGEDLFEFFVRRPKDFVHCIHLSDKQLRDFIMLADQLKKYSAEGVYARELRRKLVLTEILLLCNEVFSGNNDGVRYQNCFNNRIRPVLSFIREHLSEELPLERLSQEFFISKSHLITLFKDTVGMTPNEYIITLRVMKSREYLKAGYSVVKTCELIGYGDESHFIRVFKRIAGITPKQYGLKYTYHTDLKS